jgi:two-component system, sensor histidine kinase RegB
MSFQTIYKKITNHFLGNGFPDENRTKITWLIRLRWIAICSQLIGLYAAITMEWIDSPFISIYLITIANLLILNICTYNLTKKRNHISIYIVFFQLLCDLSSVTFLILLSGGVWNPFVQIIFLNISLGAILLRGKIAFLFFLFAICCVLFLHYPTYMHPAISNFPTTSRILLPAQIIVSSLIFFFTHWLSCSLSLQKKYSEKLQNDNNRIDKLRALGALSSGFSHEFATPLNTIKLRSSRLARINNLENNEDFKIILKAINQCENAIKQMHCRTLSDNESYFEQKNIADLVNKIIKSWHTKNRMVILKIEDKVKHSVCSIPVLPFTKAFIDILDNAEQANYAIDKNHSSDPSKAIISVYLKIETDFISLSVNDNGSGWPEIVKKYAGQPFFTTKKSGVGLGLYNGFTFASAVGGKFILFDNKNGGACAQFLIPIFKEGTSYV